MEGPSAKETQWKASIPSGLCFPVCKGQETAPKSSPEHKEASKADLALQEAAELGALRLKAGWVGRGRASCDWCEALRPDQ